MTPQIVIDSWGTPFRSKGAEENWLIFKNVFHRLQDLSILRCRKSSQESKRLARLRRGATSGQTKGQKINAQAVEAWAGIWGRV